MKVSWILVAPLSLCLFIAALYGQFLWNPILFDDLPFFMLSDTGEQPIDHYHYSPLELRSLPYATLAWGKELFGLNMLHFRIENMVLHAAVAVSLFFFLSRLLGHVFPVRGGTLLSVRAVSFCAALLFALHPVAVYAAGYLVQRSIVMATLFSLLAMLAWMHGSLKERRVWLWVGVFFYYLAVFSKEHAVMLPVVLVALTVLLHADWQARLKRVWAELLALAGIMLFVVAAKMGVIGSTYEIYAPEMLDAEHDQNYLLSVLTQSWLFFKYAGLWLIPNPRWMSADMREPFAASLFSIYALAFAAFVAWGIVAIRMLFKRERAGLLGFAMLFPWVMFMTELSTVRIQEIFVLYRSYLWAVGACVILPLLLDYLDRRIAGVIVAAVVLALFPISMDRLASFSHPWMLWDDAEKLIENRNDLPGAYRIYYNRGTELVKIDEVDAAIRDFERAIELHPEWPFIYNNLGAAYVKKKQWPEAVEAFTRAIEIFDERGKGFYPRSFFGRGTAYEAMGKLELARNDYQKSCMAAKIGCDKL